MFKKSLICCATALLLAQSLAHAQDSGDPPLPPSMLEVQGNVTRVDIARSTIWIGRREFRFSEDTEAYVGNRRVTDLRDILVGSEVGYLAEDGDLKTFWAPASDGQ